MKDVEQCEIRLWRERLKTLKILAALAAALAFSAGRIYASKTVTETSAADFAKGSLYGVFIDSADDKIKCEDRWTNLDAGAEPLYGCRAAYENGAAVLFGGGTSTSSQVYSNKTFLFSLQAGSWQEVSVSSAPSPRTSFALTGDGLGNVVLFGGWDGTDTLDDTWIFSGGDWQIVNCSTHPPARVSANMATPGGGRLLLFGGQKGPQVFDDTWIFDTAARDWQILDTAVKPSARANYAMSPAGTGKVLLYGGESGAAYLDDCWIYVEGSTYSWRQIDASASNPGKRTDSAMSYDAGIDRVVLYGGESKPLSSITYNQDLWIFNPSAEEWTKIYSFTSPPPPRKNFAFCAAGGEFILSGGETLETATTSREIFHDTWRCVIRSTGIYVSRLYDTGLSPNPVEYKKLYWFSSGNGEVKFQIASSSSPDTLVFTGPAGAASYYSTTPVILGNSRDSLRYFREKIFFSCAPEDIYGFSFDSSNLEYNHKPGIPVLYNLLLSDGDTISQQNAKFLWWDTVDPDGEYHTYEVRISTAQDFSAYISSAGIPERHDGTGYSGYSFTPSGEGGYFWKVRASDDLSSSDFSQPWSFSVDRTAPGKITDLSAEKLPRERGSVKLGWTAPGDDGTLGGITGGKCRIWYRENSPIQVWFPDIPEIIFSTSASRGRKMSYTVKGLKDGTIYYFTVAMKDEAIDTNYNWAVISNNASTGTDSSPLINITAPAYTQMIKEQFSFGWSVSDPDEGDEVFTDIYFSTNAGASYDSLGRNLTEETTYFILDTLSYNNSGRCLFKVRSSDLAGVYVVSVSTPFVLRNDNYAPSVNIVTPAEGEVIGGVKQIEWNISDANITDSHLSEVYISSDGTHNAALAGPTENKYYQLDTMLYPNGTYFITVNTRDSGSPEETGTSFVRAYIYNKNTPPADFSPVAPEDGALLNYSNPVFSWENAIDAEGDAVSYILYISTHADFSGMAAYPSAANSYSMDALENGYYYWKVKAVDYRGMEKESAQIFSFSVLAGSLTLVSSFPADAAYTMSISSAVLVFNNRLDGDSVAGNVSVTEDGYPFETSLSTSANIIVIYADFQASHEYAVSAGKGLKDSSGTALSNAGSFSFRTAVPPLTEENVFFRSDGVSVEVSSGCFAEPVFISASRDYSTGSEARQARKTSGSARFLSDYSIKITVRGMNGNEVASAENLAVDFPLSSSNGYVAALPAPSAYIQQSDIYVLEFSGGLWKKASQANSGGEIKVYTVPPGNYALAGVKPASSAVASLRNIPNPMKDKTAFWFDNPNGTEAVIKIYALTGEKVFDRKYSPSAVPVEWDGRDTGGFKLPDGMYILTVEASGVKMKKLIGIVR